MYLAEAQEGIPCPTFLLIRIVCQVAGRLQGRMPGDLGNVGEASLSPPQLESLLTLVFADVEKLNLETKLLSPRSSKKEVSWQPLAHRQRRLLELVSRLLACAQRIYWAQVDFRAMENPSKCLIDAYFDISKDSDDEMEDLHPLHSSRKKPRERFLTRVDTIQSGSLEHFP